VTKTALIADDDSSVRGMLSRLLRPLGWTTIEVADGCSAVEKLSSEHVDMLILDQRMPELTGLEVLSVVRGSATHADLPVMIVTGAGDAETSQTMLALGISDYLVKPLRSEFVRERLSRMDRAIRASAPKRRVKGQERPEDGSVLVVVDADAEHRSFVSTVLVHRYEVLEVASGVAALRACLVTRPAIFILGSDVGLMTPQFLARKLRERRDLHGIRIVLVTAKTPVESPESFDGLITKTFVPAEFSDQFDLIFAPSFDDDSDVLGRARRTVEGATEQAIGMMANTAITMTRGNDQSVTPGQLQAHVDVELETERVTFRLLLRCNPDDACAIGSLMLSIPQSDVTPDDGLATLGELANIIAGRVKTSIVSGGGKATFTVPEIDMHPRFEAPLPSDCMLEFSPEGASFQLVVVLQLLPRRKRPATPGETSNAHELEARSA